MHTVAEMEFAALKVMKVLLCVGTDMTAVCPRMSVILAGGGLS